MSNSDVPEEPTVSVTKVDNTQEDESPNLPQRVATNGVPDNRDASGADENVVEAATSKNEEDNGDKRDEHAKPDQSDQHRNSSPPPDDANAQQPQQIRQTDADDDSDAVKPGDTSTSPNPTTDVAKLESTNEKEKECGSAPSGAQTETKGSNGSGSLNKNIEESKESEGMPVPEENDAVDNLPKNDTQDRSDATSKTEDGETVDAMEIDVKPAATDSGEPISEGVKELLNDEPSEDKEAAGSGAEEMDIDSESVKDDTNLRIEEQVEENQNDVQGETETRNASENPTNVGSNDASSKQAVEHDAEERKSSESRVERERTGDDIDEEEDSEKDESEPRGQDEEMSTEAKASMPEEEESAVRDSGENQSKSGRPRRSSARNSYEPRSLRPRTAGRVNNSGTALEQPKEDMARAGALSDSPHAKNASTSDLDEERLNDADDENVPTPTIEANGLIMRIEEAVFVTKDQLDEFKIARLTDKKVKPFEELTFQDLRTYNRDQLRAYCYAYGMARRKKTEMEADMARYLSYWNKGREGFALHEYVPTSSRVIDRVEPNSADNLTTVRGTTSTGSASQDGSLTPSASNGKASGSTIKPASSRAVTPSKGGTAVNSARPSPSQGSSGPGGGVTGVSASTGNAVQSGSSQAGSHRIATTGNRTAKLGSGAPVLPRGFGTSSKQKVHARQAGAKFKAAYNGAGPAIVNIVENAAAYFEGKDSPEVILDQAKSYERYQFNVDMLNEIFDGIPEDSDENDSDVVMGDALSVPATTNNDPAKKSNGDSNVDVLSAVASRVASGKRKAQSLELAVLEKRFRETEERNKHTERTNMRLFQRLERAETKEQVEAVKREFEAAHSITFDESMPPPLVRRKLDKSLPPVVMSDEKCRILRFKVS